MNYKAISLILAVLVITLMVIMFQYPSLLVQNNNQSPQPQIQQTGDKAPAGFPAEFVPPKGVTDLNNYTTKFENRTDLNQQFMTDMAPAAVIAYYDKIFKANGWTAQTVADETKNKVVVASKGDLTAGLFVSVITGSDGSTQTSVRVSVSQTPAAGK